jgi:hypothetical protein
MARTKFVSRGFNAHDLVMSSGPLPKPMTTTVHPEVEVSFGTMLDGACDIQIDALAVSSRVLLLSGDGS